MLRNLAATHTWALALRMDCRQAIFWCVVREGAS